MAHVNNTQGIHSTRHTVRKKNETLNRQQRSRVAMQGRQIKKGSSGCPNATIATILFLSTVALGASFA